MPSPIAHITVGYIVSRFFQRDSAEQRIYRIGPLTLVAAISILASMLPDIDAIPGLLTKDFGGYHNNGTHSLIVGLGLALLAGLIARSLGRHDYGTWLLLVLASYDLHVLMDFFTYDSRGVMLFWPFSEERSAAAITLFYGVRWSKGLWAIEHLITLFTELAFVLLVLGLVRWIDRRRLRGA